MKDGGDGTFTFRDRTDLASFALESPVPEHSTRKIYQRERWTVAQYLLALAYADKLDLPLKMEHRGYLVSGGAPDFMLDLAAGTKLGIEVTSATTSDLQDYYAKNERGELDPKEDPWGPGWSGNTPEQYWAKMVLTFISRKMGALAKGHFLPAVRHELVIYADTGAPGPDINLAVNILREQLAAAAGFSAAAFGPISVVTTYGTLVYDVAGDYRILQIPVP